MCGGRDGQTDGRRTTPKERTKARRGKRGVQAIITKRDYERRGRLGDVGVCSGNEASSSASAGVASARGRLGAEAGAGNVSEAANGMDSDTAD